MSLVRSTYDTGGGGVRGLSSPGLNAVFLLYALFKLFIKNSSCNFSDTAYDKIFENIG